MHVHISLVHSLRFIFSCQSEWKSTDGKISQWWQKPWKPSLSGLSVLSRDLFYWLMTTNSVDWHGSKQAWSTFFFFFGPVSFKNEFVFAWLKILCVKWPVVWTVKAESLSELADLKEQHENNLPTRVFSFLHDPFDPWCEGAVCSATYRGHHFPT